MKIGRQKLIVTNEHGSWAVLFVPMLTGILSTKIFSITILPFFFLVLFSFMLYKPAEIMCHEWSAGRRKNQKFQNALVSFLYYGLFAAGFLVYEILFLQKYLLLAFGAAAVIIFLLSVNIKSSGAFKFLREFLGVIILTSTAPIAIYCLENRISDDALTLWFLNFLFFSSGACYVNFFNRKTFRYKREGHPEEENFLKSDSSYLSFSIEPLSSFVLHCFSRPIF
ncbi:MAG: YwiC-like family protein [Ignavibacteriaceae bacterium]